MVSMLESRLERLHCKLDTPDLVTLEMVRLELDDEVTKQYALLGAYLSEFDDFLEGNIDQLEESMPSESDPCEEVQEEMNL